MPANQANQLSQARHLIQAALASRASITEPDTSGGATKAGHVDVRLSNGKRNRLVLELFASARTPATKQNSVLVLNRASARTRERLRRDRRSFVDIGHGTVYLELPHLIVDRTDLRRARRKPATRPLRNPFADHASLVSRVLVEYPGRTWNTRELAAAAGVSTMTASHVVRQLRTLGVLEVERFGRSNHVRLPQVSMLVEFWAGSYDWTRNPHVTFSAPIGDTRRFLPKLKRLMTGNRWALTMHAGASLVAPHAAWDKIHLYLDSRSARDLTGVFELAGYQQADDGRLVVMRPWYRDSVWHGLRSIKGLPVVSNLQLIVDLWNYEVRGREQAEFILDTTLEAASNE